MSFFDKVKQSASEAADTVKDKVSETKLKNEIVQSYEELGRKTFELAEDGKLKNRTLSPYVKHIRDLRKQLADSEQPDYAK